MDSSLEPVAARTGERSNWEVLSMLRFFLAFIVASSHLESYPLHLGALRWVAQLGSFEAVLGFLLISGYSIGQSIRKEPHGFFLRRLWRVYPIYLAAILLTYFLHREPLNAAFAGNLLLNLFFLTQILTQLSYVLAAWSLSLEIWLYALAPLLLRLRATSLEWLISLSFLGYVIYSCGRTLFHWPAFFGSLYGINLPCLAFVWLGGFYLATSPENSRRALKIIGLLFAGHVGLILVIQGGYRLKHHDLHGFLHLDVVDFFSHGALLFFVYLIFSGILSHRYHLTLFVRRIFRFFGDISYPFYLVHVAIFNFLVLYAPSVPLLLLGALTTATAVYFGCDFYSRRRKLT